MPRSVMGLKVAGCDPFSMLGQHDYADVSMKMVPLVDPRQPLKYRDRRKTDARGLRLVSFLEIVAGKVYDLVERQMSSLSVATR